MHSFECFNKTELPPNSAFFSKQSGEGISDEDYEHAREVWRAFDIKKKLGEYPILYLNMDVVLFADVFKNFREMHMRHYGLAPAYYYYSAPGLSWDALLKHSKANIESLRD